MNDKERRERIEHRTVEFLNAWTSFGAIVRMSVAVTIILLVGWVAIQVVQMVGFLAIAIAP